MKKISLRAALLCAVAATPLMAVAQDSAPWETDVPGPGGGFIEPDTGTGPATDPWMLDDTDPFGDESSFADPFGENAQDETSRPERQDLPPPGTEVSMAGYDDMLAGLNEDIDARLNQLSLNGDDAKATGLPDPEIDGYRSTLDQLSADQREIKLLESKLEKAQLAKRVWQELYTDDRDDLASQVTELQAANDQILSAAEARESELLAQREADQARLMALEFELEMAKAQVEEEVAVSAVEEVPGVQASGPTIAPVLRDPPKVEAITIIGGRRAARVSFVEGGLRTVGVGDSLGAAYGTVASVDAGEVKVKLPDGTEISLERGTYRDTRTTAEFPTIDDSEFDYMPEYLDDAATSAN